MISQSNQQVRRVAMNVPHSANPKPSWYGESVGHYEGDTLVIDTIGVSEKIARSTSTELHTRRKVRVVRTLADHRRLAR
jgi:hypothetical protein